MQLSNKGLSEELIHYELVLVLLTMSCIHSNKYDMCE